MKAELIHLLEELKGPRGPVGFHALIVFPNGTVRAVHRWGSMGFADLQALEEWLYAPGAAELANRQSAITKGQAEARP